MNFNFKDVNNDVSKDSPISAQLIGIKMCKKKKKKEEKENWETSFLFQRNYGEMKKGTGGTS